jgi:tetratricopeptide (TPR) repeat protein
MKKTGRTSSTKRIDRSKILDIELKNIHYLAGHSIQLIYQPNPKNPEEIGDVLFVDEDDGTRIILPMRDTYARIEDRSDPQQSAFWASLFSMKFHAFADDHDEKLSFSNDGSYDSELGNRLRERLGGPDLSAQLSSIEFLISQGSHSFKFIGDSLAASTANAYNKDTLNHNLATVVGGLESRSIHAPSELSLQIGLVFYADQDYRSAALFFGRAGDGPIHDDTVFFFSGYAHYWVGAHGGSIKDFQESERDYRMFLKKTHDNRFDAIVQTSLGIDLRRLGRDDDAIELYKSAIRLDPKSPFPYNDLAYLYAEQGKNLPTALDLVNTALRLESNEIEIANDKDTKGWILFRQGKPGEALPLIEAAAAKIPEDEDIQKHLKAVRATMPGSK